MKLKTLLLTMAMLMVLVEGSAAQTLYSLHKCKELATANNVEVKNATLAVEAAQQTQSNA